MKIHPSILVIILLLLSPSIYAQLYNNFDVPTSINDDGTAPDASAQLDVQSTTRGMLVPRMSTKQRNAIKNAATGLLVFDISTNSFWFYNGTAWQNLSAADTDWVSTPSGVYNIMDDVGIGIYPHYNKKLLIKQDVTGFDVAAISALRATAEGAANGGVSWFFDGVDAAVNGHSPYGNNFSAGVYGSSFLDYENSAAVIGVGLNYADFNVEVFGALGYKDLYNDLYAGYFKGDFKLKKALNTDGISIESENNTNQWLVNINSTHNDFDFRYNSFVRAYISDVDGYYTNTSDRSLKTEIEYLSGILPKITQLKPAKYFYKSSTDAPQKSHGFIAQEVQAIFPELVHEREGLLTLAYDNFAILSIQAIKEQQAEIESLEQRLEKLEALLLEKE